MAIVTDLITPTTLTTYARESLEAAEARKPSLARWLPNRMVNGIDVKFNVTQTGLVEEARFRAYDAELEEVGNRGGRTVKLELPAIGSTHKVSEYRQLKARGASDQELQDAIYGNVDDQVQGVHDRMERLRGAVLVNGIAAVNQDNFKLADDFGRDPRLNFTAPTLFTAAGSHPLVDIETWSDLYYSINGVYPAVMLTSRRVSRAIQYNADLATLLVGGSTRAATPDQVRAALDAQDLPTLEIYDRRTSAGLVIPDDRIVFLPPIGDNKLGATFWGRTATADIPGFGLKSADAPGLVAGVWRNDKPPALTETIVDAIGEPVLANANLSMVVKVL